MAIVYTLVIPGKFVDVIRDATGDRVETWKDDRTRLLESRPATAGESGRATAVENESTLRTKAAQALTTNATFLAIASPSNAQTLAQVQRLTRECNALIRLLVGQLDDITGT